MRPIKSGPLIDQEIEELDAFLLSEGVEALGSSQQLGQRDD